MKLILLCVFVGLFVLQVQAQDDVWFDPGGENYTLNVSVGRFNDTGKTGYLSLQIPFVNDSTLAISYAKLQGDNATVDALQNDYSTVKIAAHSDPLAVITVSGSYSATESNNGERNQHWRASFGYNWMHWSLEGSVLAGEDRFERLYDLRTGQTITKDTRRERVGLGIGLNYFTSAWTLMFSFSDYALIVDDLLEDEIMRRQLFERDLITSRRATTTSSGVYSYLEAVSEREAQLGIATELQRIQLSAGISSYETMEDSTWLNTLYFSCYYPLTKMIDAGVLFSAMDDSTYYGELGASLHW